MRSFSNPLLILLAASISISCASQKSTTADVASVKAPAIVNTFTYTPAGWPEPLQGDLYLPGTPPGELTPGVLLIHGGAWSGRDRSDMNGIARKLVKNGYAVFNISHRFAPEHPFPAQIHDAQLAVSWLREHAASYAIDPDRIAAWGFSSGAHLAALLGVLDSGDALSQPYGGESARVSAVVAAGAPVDLRKFEGDESLINLLGGTRAEVPEEYELASPAFYVDPPDAPFFLSHGAQDGTVPLDQATDFAMQLEEAQVKHELKVAPILGHATLFVLGKGAEKDAIQFLDDTL